MGGGASDKRGGRVKPRIRKEGIKYVCACDVWVPSSYRMVQSNHYLSVSGYGPTPEAAYDDWVSELPVVNRTTLVFAKNEADARRKRDARLAMRRENLRLFRLSLSRHSGLKLCWIYPALGLLSGVMGMADKQQLERALLASGALAVLVWTMVAVTAWTGRHQYKDTSTETSTQREP